MQTWLVRITLLLCECVLALLLACTESSAPLTTGDSGPELIHEISEYDDQYQETANDVANKLMQHWPKESYVRWRPVRIEPSEVLTHNFLKSGAMPESLRISPFPDTTLHVLQESFSAIEHISQALWVGTIANSDFSNVRISIIGTDGIEAFVIKIWDPPNRYYIFATDTPDVYVAVEGRVDDGGTVDWPPNL